MTVQTDESSDAAETCSVTACCHAVLTTDCSTLRIRGWRSSRSPTDVCTRGRSRHIQSMPTAVEDVLELSLAARGILADVQVRRRGCVSIRRPQS